MMSVPAVSTFVLDLTVKVGWVHYAFLTGSVLRSKTVAGAPQNVAIFNIFLRPTTREYRSVRIA